MLGAALFWANTGDTRVVFLHSLILLVLPYIGLVLGGKVRRVARARAARGHCSGRRRRSAAIASSTPASSSTAASPTSARPGFVDGTLVVPQFVLKELQQVADSADSLRRNRGRRGLDILQRIQKMAGLDVIISDIGFSRACAKWI